MTARAAKLLLVAWLLLLAGVCYAETAKAADTEVGYAENTTNTITSTTTTPVTLASVGPITFDGSTKVRVEFYATAVYNDGTGALAVVDLNDGGTNVQEVYASGNSTSGFYPFTATREYTPSAGTRTVTAALWNGTAGHTSVVRCFSTCFLRVTKDVAAGGGGSTTLAGLTDVDTTGKVVGSVLKYDGTSKWIVGTDSAGSGGAGGPLSLDDPSLQRLDYISTAIWFLIGLIACLAAGRYVINPLLGSRRVHA